MDEHLRTEMLASQAVYESAANLNQAAAPAYHVGDKVWLSTKNIKTRWTSKKLDHKFIRPYKVEKIMSPYVYKLCLPDSMKLVHPVFHMLLL